MRINRKENPQGLACKKVKQHFEGLEGNTDLLTSSLKQYASLLF